MNIDNNKIRRYYSEYETIGNTARKLNIADAPYTDNDVKTATDIQKHRQPKLRHDMDLFTVLVLTAALVAAVYLCVGYLKVQSDIVQMKKHIITLESELENINDLNEVLCMKVNSAVDLEYIYDVAVNELGMVFSNENDVVNYTRSYNSFVRQYEVVERSDESNLLGQFFNE